MGRPAPGRLTKGRLTKRPQYLAVATGRRFHTERVTVQGRHRRADEPESGLRLGFTVTKKSGHATERNRIRRRLKAAASEASGSFRTECADIVVVGRHAAITAPYRLLVEDLARALTRLTAAESAEAGTSSNARGRRRGRSRTA